LILIIITKSSMYYLQMKSINIIPSVVYAVIDPGCVVLKRSV
jgi:hypothetical protein